MTTENETTHTHHEIDQASESLLEWAKENRNVFAVAAMFGEDNESHFPQPEAIVAAAMSEISEGDIAALIAQLHIAVLMMIDRIAEGAEMGEEAFRRLFNTLTNHMLHAAGVTQIGETASNSQTTDTKTQKEIK